MPRNIHEQARFLPLAETALIVDFGNRILVETNEFVQRLAAEIQSANFKGIIELVPAYSSLAIFYDPAIIRREFPMFPTAFAAVESFIKQLLPRVAEKPPTDTARRLRVPICFDVEFALDLDLIAAEKSLTIQEFKTIFLQETYRVFMLGFLPGFAYMGAVSERIAIGRKPQPRARVAPGSVGVAGRQTGVYPLESPGGWQIIGRTPLQLFDARKNPPTHFQPNDAVRFFEIDKQEFAALAKNRIG